MFLGLSSTPTWDLVEGSWGYRAVEKTALDLYKYGSSRDFGVAAKGTFDEAGRVGYHVMVGNGSGTKGETNEGKKFMGALSLRPVDGLVLQVYGDFDDRPGATDRTTLQGFAAFEGERGRLGVQYAHQTREREGEADLELDVASVWGVVELSERVRALARWDRLIDPVPDGAKISYVSLDPTDQGNFVLLGLDVAVAERFHLIPNVEFVTYDEDDGTPRDADVFLRTTFSITF
ncbi:MAG: hypothetical protein D6701_11650 [Gemmatimonadetes bacterium]|nr:MAG: hypothetical protein D6701_11650 [Gemmatimonadota bacterium]